MKSSLHSGFFRAVVLQVCLAMLMLAGCGGGGGGGGGGDGGGGTTPTPPNSGGTPVAPPPTSTAPLYPGFDFPLAAGDYWRFGWDATRSSFAQGSPSTSGSGSGVFQITLGSSTAIAGVTMYPVQLSGNPIAVVNGDVVSLKPRWLYVGMKNSQMLGSTDGTTVTTIFDAQTGRWGGGGFFTTFPATTLITTQSSVLTNNYMTNVAAVKAGRSINQAQCETIAGITICGDSSQTLTEDEYYKAAIGPLGYHYLNAFSFSGGGFISGGRFEYNIGLVASSRRGDVVTNLLEVEPNNRVAQAMPLTRPATVDGAALNETNYGGVTIVPTEVEPNDSFASAQAIALPAWIGGAVQAGDTATTINIPLLNSVPAYTATFEDFYRFTPSLTGTVAVQLKFPNTSADLDVYVFTLAGNVPTIIARGILDNVQAVDFSESLSFTATAGTTYYIAVDGFLTPARAPYELLVYNSTPPTSHAVVDWFKVTLATAGSLSISVTGGASIVVANSTGTSQLGFASPLSAGGSATLVTSTLPAGTYLVGLTAGGAYRLTVN